MVIEFPIKNSRPDIFTDLPFEVTGEYNSSPLPEEVLVQTSCSYPSYPLLQCYSFAQDRWEAPAVIETPVCRKEPEFNTLLFQTS